jgi:hypothetical protein
MPSDRDDLARIIFTATATNLWLTWEQTSEGIRAWCRAKADEAMAAGWRKVGAGQCIANSQDLDHAYDITGRRFDETHDTEWLDIHALIGSALADPAGANGGE